MPESDFWKRSLDAGLTFTSLTRSRAEAIVRDLVKAGEVRREQAQERVEYLLDRSRRNTEQLVSLIRKEIAQQLSAAGLATKDDLARLEAKLTRAGARPAAKKPATATKKRG